MNEYIATFYSHFGAVRFRKDMQKQGLAATLMPVPRNLSSSCGTCASFLAAELPEVGNYDEIEQIVRCGEQEYEVLYKAED